MEYTTVILGLSTILNLFFLLKLILIKEKKKIVFWSISFSSFLFLWTLGYLLMMIFYNVSGEIYNIYVYVAYFGLYFLSATFMITGYVFKFEEVKLSSKINFVFIIPIISTIISLTNEEHFLLFKKYYLTTKETEYGGFYKIHVVICCIFFAIGSYFILSSIIKESGITSKRSILALLSTICPIIFSIVYVFQLIDLPTPTISVVFSFGFLFLFYAIHKHKFTKIVPIALKQIVDRISDSYIVINDYMSIVEYNKTMEQTLKGISKIFVGSNINDFLDKVVNNSHNFKHFINRTMKEKKTFNFEVTFKNDDPLRYFKVETTPIIKKYSYVGTIILFKDITEHKNFIKMMNESYSMLMDKERLVTLGQFMGGIAHNIKTPLMSISGGLDAIKELINEYDESIEDKNVTADDHHEIAYEMKDWIKKNMSTVRYISDIISTVKSQAVGNDNTDEKFTISNLLKRIEILMDHGLRLNHCKLKITNNVNDDLLISGNITSLIQIFNNIIVNAADSYGGKGGVIHMKIDEKDGKVLFVIEDEGKGIDRNIQSRLFKEMVTTKGMNGTGLGLYISYSTVKVMFKGDIWFESEPEKGTKFFILI